MTVISTSTLIARSPEDVFDYMVDLRNELEWNPRLTTMEKTTDGPIGLGTAFAGKFRGSPSFTATCEQFERPRAWTYHYGGSVEIMFGCRADPAPGGSVLHVDADARPHGLFKILFPLLVRRIRKSEAESMERLRRAIESRQAP